MLSLNFVIKGHYLTIYFKFDLVELQVRISSYYKQKCYLLELLILFLCVLVLDQKDEGGCLVVVVVGDGGLYVRCGTVIESKAWRHHIRAAALRNGTALHQQQMTKDDVPLIVDKCINFIYAHGMMFYI